MNSPVEEIKAKLNIVDLVGTYVRLQKSGTHWKAPCPFHHEKTPSFMVNEERQIWHCFGCNKGGDLFSFLMDIEGIEFKEALRILAEKTGVELPRYSREASTGPQDRTYEILELATKFYEKQLWDGVGKRQSLPYLRERGLTEETMRRFRLGYAPEGWRNLHDFLVGRGYSPLELEKAGLAIRKERGGYYDRFRDRIMFPIMDVLGRVIGYSARVSPGGDETQAKYINTPETGVYRKSQVLYGIQLAKQAMKAQDFALLVEGNMDVIASHQAGIANTVAVSGTALTAEQLQLIKRYTENLRLFFDMDGAGQVAARRSTELALEKGMNVWIVAIPQGKDAADIARESPNDLKQAVEKPLLALQYFLDQLLTRYDANTPEGKRRIAEEYLQLLRFVTHTIDQAYWVKRLAEALEMEEGVLRNVLQKLPTAQTGNAAETKENSASFSASQSVVFERRSGLLGRKILSLIPLDSVVWEEAVVTIEERFKTFFEKYALYSLLRDGAAQDYPVFEGFLSTLSTEEQKQEATRLYFEGEKTVEGLVFGDEEERRKHLRELLGGYFKELTKELRKEEMVVLEREMRKAREAGDRDRERALGEAFKALSRLLSNDSAS
jgi:DNA primase